MYTISIYIHVYIIYVCTYIYIIYRYHIRIWLHLFSLMKGFLMIQQVLRTGHTNQSFESPIQTPHPVSRASHSNRGHGFRGVASHPATYVNGDPERWTN